MSQHFVAATRSERGRRLAQVWAKVDEIEMPPEATLEETWEMANWLYDRVIEGELARDHADTIQSVLEASHF